MEKTWIANIGSRSDTFRGAALASDHDERFERREWREHRHHPRFRAHFYFGPSYRNGYYDRWGYWHPYWMTSVPIEQAKNHRTFTWQCL